MAQVVASSTLLRGLRTYFWDTYKSMASKVNPMLSLMMDLSLPSDAARETYAYFDSAPHPERWDKGASVPEDGFKSYSFSVVNYDWATSVPWHANDEADDQTQSLENRVKEAGDNFAILDERLGFQLLTATTDAKLLPGIPNAPDGAALFATTDGSGAARFGATNGNSIVQTGGAGLGVAATASVVKDYYRGVAQFRKFQDTKGQPLWPPEIIRQGVVVIHGSANEQVFEQAFDQKLFLAPQTNAAGSENVGGAAVSNVLMDTGKKVVRYSTPRITDGTWYIGLIGTSKRALFKQTREPVTDYLSDFPNSDRARDTKVKRWQWESRAGYGISLPYQLMKIA
jgi:hypothetical protein